ncbi:Planctomycete cytochrome C [Singulisphaera sp. GP187]|uniref:c-type cytochrome domain-containing protein n=1 Tax=Singulisphaera sp. GP187 TaxID=1882752 RepID=UPI00092BE1F1|nr:c-type cytochrome domain-containing protein [Singulisphaera sp. GP187]SIO57109.1 Planctomycete cytochrome C [Singulisphaera sp. GP187]
MLLPLRRPNHPLVAFTLFSIIVASPSTTKQGHAADRLAGTAAEATRAMLEKYCYRCHGQDGRNEGGLNVVTDLKKLVESKRVVPGVPERSKLLKRVVNGDMPPEVDFEDRAANPPRLPRPSAKDVARLRDWIQGGASEVAASRVAGVRRFITEIEILKLILDDLRGLGTRERRFIRYFTLTHLANAGYNEDQLQTYRHGLSKLINSLSWNRRITVPKPIDPGRVILRIDLRDYLWDEGTWSAILSGYPYGINYNGATAEAIDTMTACELAFVRADWFVYAASRPPLYHDVLRLPASIEELEKKLDVDALANIRQDRAARAGFNASGISRNNRLIERHESTNGGYWRSYDFGGNADRKNLFAHPLGPGDGAFDFEHDGGETVFALPNGLNGYMLTDGHGQRIDKGPTEIVRDNKQADGAVVNGISCMSCHNRGFIEKADQVRDVVVKSRSFGKEVADAVIALYPPRARMDELMRGDLDRYARAVKETGAALSRTEPVFALATRFEEEVDIALAAAEAGLMVKEFRDLLALSPPLGQALGLLLAEGTVKRDLYVNAFPLIAEARHQTLLDIAKPTPVQVTKPNTTPKPRDGGFPSEFGSFPRNRLAMPGTSQNPHINSNFNNQSNFNPRANPNPGSAVKTYPTAASGSRKGYAPDRLADVPPTFWGGDRDKFRDIGPVGSVLVGVRISTHLFFGGPKISSVQPIYRVGTRLIEGKRHGTVASTETTTVAKSDYAVGGFRTHTGLGVDGFEIVYMRIKNGRLVPTDSYTSPWLGDPNGGSPKDVFSSGEVPVGLQGRSTKAIHALGLIIAK